MGSQSCQALFIQLFQAHFTTQRLASRRLAMSQVLSITSDAKSAEAALQQFFEHWRAIGSLEPAEQGYTLIAHSGDRGLLTIESNEILFQGEFNEQGFAAIQTLAEALGEELLLEGKPLQNKTGLALPWRLGRLGKTAAILSGLVILPLAILALPVLLLVMLVRLLFILLRSD
jgi:hypothetical protein